METIRETFWRLIGVLLNSPGDLRAMEDLQLTFAAPWVRRGPAWLLFGCLALCALALVFYFRWQHRGRRRARMAMAVSRAALLCLLLLVLAEPVLTYVETLNLRPVLWVLVDGTQSMELKDKLAPAEREALSKAVGRDEIPPATEDDWNRLDYVKALLARRDANLLEQLGDRFDVRVFLLDRPDGVAALPAPPPGEKMRPQDVVERLQARAAVTNLASAFDDLGSKHAARNLAALVMISDFNDTTGFAEDAEALPLRAARRLGVPVHTVGIGPRTAIDLSVSIQPPPVMKKDERSVVVVTLRHTGLEGRSVQVRLMRRGLEDEASRRESQVLDAQVVDLAASPHTIEFPYTPDEAGRFIFAAEVDPLEDEVVTANNQHEREVQVRDDFMRLMFVEYEPTWEWRFIKEVFHRDKLVGLRGFRTYLRSSDPKVRETNELYLRTLTPPRSEFFANDVILLSDLPAAALSTNFCNLVKEFVSEFGGGLVVLAGPRFGPAELAQTPLADVLPVVLDPNLSVRDQQEFPLVLDEAGVAMFDFMRLGADENEHRRAWNNLGLLPWYQPVRHLHPSGSFVLATHPADTTSDNKSRQPIIAIRNYGRGQVVWLGFNETWRLRRKYGERYYRQFWGQMIHHLGLRHAMGAQKRFVVQVDKPAYDSNQKAVLTVEAYDENYRRLSEGKLRELGLESGLQAQWIRPDDDGGEQEENLTIPLFKEGIFETELTVFGEGEHLVRVQDPIANESAVVNFRVTRVSRELRDPVRNYRLQQQIAEATGGRAYELTEASRLAAQIESPELTEVTPRVVPLWNTPLAFVLIVGLMLGEWLFRKLVNLP